MDIITVLYALGFYASTGVLVLGVFRKIKLYWQLPNPLVIPTTPAPITVTGARLRVIREVTIFESLFRGNKWIWVLAILFHYGLLLVSLRHLRYFLEQLPQWLISLQTLGIYAGTVMIIGLIGLLIRRLFVERIRYISTPSDYLHLVLLLSITGSGFCLQWLARTDVLAVKNFMMGLLRFDWQPLPHDGFLLLHLALVMLLMLVFPISKLMHAPGVFFSPTRTMADNPREKRHINPWAKKRSSGVKAK